MTPNRLTKKENDTTIFHYPINELRAFVKRGMEHGDTGPILIKRQSNVLTYKGYGTIENPRKSLITVSFVHSPLFSGEMIPDWERLVPPKPFFNKENTRVVMIDFSKISDNDIPPFGEEGIFIK